MNDNYGKTRNKSRRPHHEGPEKEHFNNENSRRKPDQHETRQPDRKHEASGKETRIPMVFGTALTVASALLVAFSGLSVGAAAKAAEYRADRPSARVEFKVDDFFFANADSRNQARFVKTRRNDARKAQFRQNTNYGREFSGSNFVRPGDRYVRLEEFTANSNRRDSFAAFVRSSNRQLRLARFARTVDSRAPFTRFAVDANRDTSFSFRNYNRNRARSVLFNQLNVFQACAVDRK